MSKVDEKSSSTRKNLKEKYTKKSPVNVLNSSNIKLIKYNDKDVKKLKEKYTVKTSEAHVPFEKEFIESVLTNTETKMAKSPEGEDVVSPKVNVFQFMMNSRHKVIGSNSPGKEKKPEPEKSPEEVAEKREKIKKRKAALGEWAEKKGGQKRKLADEAQEEHIKEKMKERAKRLKKMLEIIDEDLRNSSHDESDHEVKPVKNNKFETENEINIENTKETPKRRVSRRSKLNGNSVKKNLSAENETPKNKNEDETNVTKSTRSVKKSIASLSLKKNKKSTTPEAEKKTEPESTKLDDDNNIFPSTPITNKKQKQLKLFPDSNPEKREDEMKAFTPRSWKMKVRLLEKENINEEVLDSESVIVIDDKESPKKNSIQGKISNFFGSPSISSKSSDSKNVKLAPMFLKQQTKKQTKAEMEAKRKFLFSGMPDQVKKVTSRQQSMNEINFDLFPKISHVQQRSSIDGTLHIFWDLPNTALSLIEKKVELITKIQFDPLTYGTLTNSDNNTQTSKKHIYLPPTKLANLKECITTLKHQYPNYPVFKTFRLLYEKYIKHSNKIESTQSELTQKSDTGKKRRGRPKKSKNISTTETEIPIVQESQMWTEKYKPLCQDDIIGNYSSVKQLKSWLQSWVHYSEDQKQMKKRKRANSSSDDFCCNDSDTRDTGDILPQNMMILVGPFGTGKTASVYALCNELNINIIEINASSKRTGKRILTELQEATQSHQVKNTDSKSMNSFFQKKSQTNESKEEESKKLSLLLMEDVDIVFEDQDDGFISSLTTLVTSSKRPIILTTSDKNCLHLQKLLSQHDVIDFTAISCRVASPWLQILSLVEGVRSDRVMVDRLLEWNKGDVRKTLLQLQFWVQSGGDSKLDHEPLRLTQSVLDAQDENYGINDENSNLSWFDENDSKTETSSQDIHRSCVQCFTPFYERDKTSFQLEFPINLGNIWWNIPSILNFPFIGHKEIFKVTENCNDKDDIDCSQNATKCISETEISDISNGDGDTESVILFSQNSDLLDWKTAVNLLESLVFTDTMYMKLKTDDDFEPTCQFWQINPVNSLLLTENYEMYNEANNLSYEIAQWLVESNIKECNKKLNNCEIDVNVALPNLEERRWRTKVHKSMESVTDIIPPSCLLDRAGICKDYFPFMRTICRVENIRFANNNKRKNRFYHYFKTFNIHLSDSTHLILCNSLAIKNY